MDSRDPRFTQRSFFSHWVRENIRFCDQDASGHINNTAMTQYAESGRVAYLRSSLQVGTKPLRFVAANLTMNYLLEAHYPGEIHVGTRVIAVGNRSITVGFGIFKDDDCISCGISTVVCVEPGVNSLPGEVRQYLEGQLP